MGYVYRGTIRDADEPVDEVSVTGRAPFDPTKCGTNAGYKQHQNHGIMPPCQPCRDGADEYRRELKARHGAGLVVREFQDDKCGTIAGYSRHIRHGVPVCDPCQAARAEYRAAYYASNAA
ncbi:hypothetical protein [Pseudarthrobacter sp. NIBRBAC000502771]|uniref:hypothetical protein n=1 Tax=Pseudarthrobacter sp. NIBRBAC000502771 TaxID=2590774 RepID=UPI001131DB73|nr:hypothetical protein [Pseudarthrobacter sp. NIBRBAC000502771]QDG61218.1 hypothetical protein NIBR502771_02110 [Pseudarthrobacter sp. NIBRBAC000502771]